MLFGQTGIPGLNTPDILKSAQRRNAQALHAVTSANRINGKGSASRASNPVEVQRVYVIQEAPRAFVRSVRETRSTNMYRSELEQSTSKDTVTQMHVQKLDGLNRDLRASASNPEESGYIRKYMNKLDSIRQSYMRGGDYAKLSWTSSPQEPKQMAAEASQPIVESSAEKRQETAHSRKEQAAVQPQGHTENRQNREASKKEIDTKASIKYPHVQPVKTQAGSSEIED